MLETKEGELQKDIVEDCLEKNNQHNFAVISFDKNVF